MEKMNTLKEIYEFGKDAMNKSWERADICKEQGIDRETDPEYRYYKGLWDGTNKAYKIIEKHLRELESLISEMTRTL